MLTDFLLHSQYCKLAKLRFPGSLSSFENQALFSSCFILWCLNMCIPVDFMYLRWTRFIGEGGKSEERRAEAEVPAACYPKPPSHATPKSSWLMACLLPCQRSLPLSWFVIYNLLLPPLFHDPSTSAHLFLLPFRRELTHSAFLSPCSSFSHSSVRG